MAKILLADDSAHAQRMGAKILAAEGHQVVTVGNGQAAVQALEKSVPDLVVADIYMPGRDGFEVCHFIKTDERLKNVPVLLTIGAMEPYDPERGRRSRADGLITKPLESSNLIATVKELLSSSKGSASARRTKRGSAPEPKPAAVEEVVVAETIRSEQEPQGNEQPAVAESSAIPIPEEISQQPVGMLAELAEISSAGDLPPDAALNAGPQLASPAEWPPPIAPGEPILPAAEIGEPADAGQPPASPWLELVDTTVWSAEPAAITPEDEELFDRSAADWAGLAKLAEEEAPEAAVAADPPTAVPELAEPLPVSLPADSDPAAVEISTPESEFAVPIQQGLESFDSLSEVIAAPPIALAPAVLPAPYEPLMAAADAVADSVEHLPPQWSAALHTAENLPDEPAEVCPSAAIAGEADPLPNRIAGEADPVMRFSASDALGAVDELVRQTVEQMLPHIVDQIVERVLQSLKS